MYKSSYIPRKVIMKIKSRPAKPMEKPQNPARAAKDAGAKTAAQRGTRAPSVGQLPAAALPPAPGEGKRGESGYLGYLLRQAQAAARLTLERSLSELGVTVPQFAVLTMLKAYPGLSGADLARVALLTPQTVGVIIANLERDGAIQKTPHPVHGRRLQWSLTRRGLTLLDECRKRAMAQERRLAEGLAARDERVIRQWLARIAVSLHRSG
jgi:DNA-binding MarR family transcriptional regulator